VDHSQLDGLLDAAGDLVIEDGFDALTLAAIATRTGRTADDVLAAYGSLQDLMVALLNREFSRMWRVIADNIDRDPRGGLLSRIYRYTLTGVYERPLARALYLMDRDGLHTILRASYGFSYIPRLGVRADFIVRMQEAGMVRADVDARALSALLSAVSAGAALTAPDSELDQVNEGLAYLLECGADADVVDTGPGKAVFMEYATSLAAPDGRH
jgi:AcrR family transcriptional regulator